MRPTWKWTLFTFVAGLSFGVFWDHFRLVVNEIPDWSNVWEQLDDGKKVMPPAAALMVVWTIFWLRERPRTPEDTQKIADTIINQVDSKLNQMENELIAEIRRQKQGDLYESKPDNPK